MFNRKELKANAKLVLKRSYWMAFLVSLLAGLVTGGSGFSGNLNLNNSNVNSLSEDTQQLEAISDGSTEAIQQFFAENGGVVAAVVGVTFIVALLIGFAWAFFVSTPAEIGLSRFFIATREQQNPVDFSYVLYGFKYNYLKQAWAHFSTQLIIMLWSLLGVIPMIIGGILSAVTQNGNWMALGVFMLPLMIPSIIKTYQYRMVSYILANNCNINGKRARELSTEMTNGNKWNLFVLDLSFIGWIILGALACGIGILFVIPYINATNAEAYTCLKAEAMQNKGISGDEELPSLAGAAV